MNKVALRIAIPFIIVVLVVSAFKNGVVVSDKPELHQQPVSILIFHAINLFTLGAKDLGQPIDGPIGWQWTMLIMYYLAPIISLTALAEIIYLLSRPFLPLLLYRGKHYIIIGHGRVGKAGHEVLKEFFGKGIQTVFVDKQVKESGGGFNIFHWRRLYINRDINDVRTLDDLRINKCNGVIIATDNEWLNLKAYYHIKKTISENTPIFTRLASPDLINFMNAREITQGEHAIPNHHRFFNIHVAASGQLFDEQLINKDVKQGYDVFRKWHDCEIENWFFFGFGRFANSFLSEVLRDNKFMSTVKNIIIVDKSADEAWNKFVFEHGNTHRLQPVLVNELLENLGAQRELMAAYADNHSIALFGANDETRNIKAAATFTKMYDQKHLVKYIIRTRYKDSFPQELLKTTLGDSFILIPTYDWIKAYYEDELIRMGYRKS